MSNPAKSNNPAVKAPGQLERLVAEGLGTMWLVLGGCGTAIFAAGVENVGVGWLGVALAFGLTVLTGAYAFGPVSGGHFNPAVTFGLAMAGRFPWNKAPGYLIAQFVGGLVGSSIIAAILALGPAGALATAGAGGFASNGYGDHSPQGFGVGAAIIAEFVLTAVFVIVICGATAKIANGALAGLAIGLTLTLIHLISIPIDNTSVNPARSLAAAVYAAANGSGWAMEQLWLFILVPLVGGLAGGALWRYVIKQN
ncbi:MAG: aquaporin Z [Propionibacteriaceae bacterium]|jgi:aquaporin Z|nr:aquaporin Z [Propionibacteriaceae bacterium]